MNWPEIIAEIRVRGYTLDNIKDKCGFASRGHVHDVANGKQPTVSWERGDALLRLLRDVRRRLARQVAARNKEQT